MPEWEAPVSSPLSGPVCIGALRAQSDCTVWGRNPHHGPAAQGVQTKPSRDPVLPAPGSEGRRRGARLTSQAAAHAAPQPRSKLGPHTVGAARLPLGPQEAIRRSSPRGGASWRPPLGQTAIFRPRRRSSDGSVLARRHLGHPFASLAP
ncbi:hypothetical protein NDU88_007193 [Pleurodeles waltl]|uniref:Uncharacterized protein n=1 Tax=Pleurodeles waltl TaxID=8319 RepID=A0AAV7SRU9_PLEWA|nr:hypothetical protein NDU88_007193 [Pleurodeles waltl]